MSHPRWRTLVAVTVLCLATCQVLPAQTASSASQPKTGDAPSHLRVQEDPVYGVLAQDLLDSQLDALVQNFKAEKLARNVLQKSPEWAAKLKELTKLAPKDPKSFLKDPESLRRIQKLAEELGRQVNRRSGQGAHVPREQLGTFQKILERELRKTAEGKNAGSAPRSSTDRPSPRRQTPPGKARRPREAPATAAQPNSPEHQRAVQWAQRLTSWAERTGLASTFSNSPAWRRIMEGLNRFQQGDTAGLGLDSANSFLGRLGLDINPGKLFSAENWSLRNLPRPTFPKLANWLPPVPKAGPDWTAPSVGLPGGSSGGFWRGVLWIVLALFLGGALWAVLARRTGPTSPSEAGEGWQPGPWPVEPHQVATSADLIRAFEYLALLLLGLEARNWNHRQIADALAGEEQGADRRRAASGLAGLYEQARYAPSGHSLSSLELAAARRDLCLLAGVHPA